MADAINLQKLPPLKALKGFEAAARLQSIRGAAKELNLTHPAIAHQIQSLEQGVGAKLFAREGRHIVLTDAGRLFYPYVREALQTLINGTKAVQRATNTQPLRVQVYVTTSIRWLAPRLSKFRAEHPDIDLQLMSCGSGWDFDQENADIGLIYKDEPLPDHLHWTTLFESKLFPVCSPELIKGKEGTLAPKDLLNYPLITVYTEGWGWQDWFSETQVTAFDNSHSANIDTLAIALEMAINGEGMVLVNGVTANDDLLSGRLVKPIDLVVDGPGEWGVVCRHDIYDEPRTQTVIRWLLQQATASVNLLI